MRGRISEAYRRITESESLQASASRNHVTLLTRVSRLTDRHPRPIIAEHRSPSTPIASILGGKASDPHLGRPPGVDISRTAARPAVYYVPRGELCVLC